ncbi:MAG: hypothetical protein ACK4ZU_03965 [Allorhizobium sp.]
MTDQREDILAALFAALQRIPDIELCERNRTHPIPDETASALVMIDGDLDGETDREDALAAGREVTFPMTLMPRVWGYVEGSSETIGTKTNALFAKVKRALFRDTEFRHAIGIHGGRVRVLGAAFPTPEKATSPAAGAFMVYVAIPYDDDPFN